MRIKVESDLPLPADVVANLIRKPALLQHVAWPFFLMRGLPGEFSIGEATTIRLYLSGFVPLWRHTITVVSATDREALTEEHGGPLRSWRHRLSVTPLSEASCRYTDEVEIDAGRFTPLAGPFARSFYRHRHRRWASLARVLA